MDQEHNTRENNEHPNKTASHRSHNEATSTSSTGPSSRTQASSTVEVVKALGVPLAIVLAGALIAGALLWSASQKGVSGTPSEDAAPLAEETTRTPIPSVRKDDHIRGNPQAPIVVVEYSDYECPFCQRFHTTMQAIMETYGKRGEVAWVYRHFPLVSIHPKALTAARAAECAAKVGDNEAFWRFTDIYFANTPTNNKVDLSLLPQWAQKAGINQTAFEACLNKDDEAHNQKIADHTNEAISAGARGTPFSVIVTRTPIPEEVKKLLNTINQQMGQPVFTLLSDTQIAVGGALPQDLLALVFDALLGKKTQE